MTSKFISLTNYFGRRVLVSPQQIFSIDECDGWLMSDELAKRLEGLKHSMRAEFSRVRKVEVQIYPAHIQFLAREKKLFGSWKSFHFDFDALKNNADGSRIQSGIPTGVKNESDTTTISDGVQTSMVTSSYDRYVPVSSRVVQRPHEIEAAIRAGVSDLHQNGAYYQKRLAEIPAIDEKNWELFKAEVDHKLATYVHPMP